MAIKEITSEIYPPPFSVLVSKKSLDNTFYYPAPLQSCVITIKTNKTITAWGLIVSFSSNCLSHRPSFHIYCKVAFDFISIGVIMTNALDRPRHRNWELLRHLKSDGAAFFVVRTFSLWLLPQSCAFLTYTKYGKQLLLSELLFG
jgi:hypothetical protein